MSESDWLLEEISIYNADKKRKEVKIYVIAKKYDEKEIRKYASAGKDRSWL